MIRLSLTILFVLAVLRSIGQAATYYVAIDGNDSANGTVSAPWRSIQHAVDQLQPGDSALIGPGTYRECIEVQRGGTAEAPITLMSLPGARVVVSGADLLSEGWSTVAGVDGAYRHDWPHRFPINGPNDLTHPDDKEHQLTGRAEQVLHDGRLLRQVLRRDQLAPGSFHVDLERQKLEVWLRDGRDPAKSELEASTRAQWLAAAPDVSHFRVRGITFRYAANHAQRGAFVISAGSSREWVIKDCVFERANGAAVSVTGEGHQIRRCVFQDNGQLGFGAWSCHNSRLEECGIYRNNTKGYSTHWEAGALKITKSRGFAIERCRSIDNRGTGIWYDIGNEKSEVSHCYVADNDEAGIFYEISYGLHAHDNLIVNNANHRERPGDAWGHGGITLSSSEDCVIENNTLVGNRDGIAFREQNRTTPRIDGEEVRILNRNHLLRNNLIASSQAFNIGLWLDTNFFDAKTRATDASMPIFEDPKTLNIRLENNLLFALPGRPNYLFGCEWRAKSKQLSSAAEFTSASGIPDSSRVADPKFADIIARDYRFQPSSPVMTLGVGIREPQQIPPP